MKRVVLHSLPLLVLVLVAWKAVPLQQDFSKVEIKDTAVAGSVHMLEGQGGNIGVSAGTDGVLIVDDEFAPLADKIKAALAKIGPGKLRFVLNTHFHGDHTGGNKVFGTEATIVAHENVRSRLEKGSTGARKTDPEPPQALPVVTFDDGLALHFNGEEIDLVHFANCHTDGDSVVFFRGSNVVHMGDLFFNGHFPFVDLSSGGDVLGLTRGVAAVLAKLPDDAKVIPGHGPLATKADLARYQRMLVETTEHVRTQLEAGVALADVQKTGLGDEWKEWSWSFVSTAQWIETVAKSLEAAKKR
jgi:cyclase